MSQITNKDIEKIANLAKIAISKEESDLLTAQVGGIITWVEQLSEVNTDNVAPLTSVNDIGLRLEKDEVLEGDIAEDVLKNANSKYGYFAVPKVIE